MPATVPDTHIDLLRAPGVAQLATIGPDGRPQVTALWYFLDDDGTIRISVSSARQKYKNLVARPVGTLFILDPTNPMRFIEVRGDVTIEADPDYAFADRVVAHYGNPFDMRAIDTPGTMRHVVTLHPTKVNVSQ